MKKNSVEYKRFFFLSIILIALGVTFSNMLKDTMGSLGIVFIAVGGLYLIIAMRKKSLEVEQQED